MEKAPKIKETILAALESGRVLTNGEANTLTRSTEGGRILRYLRQHGYPIVTRTRPNKLRAGSVKEYYYTPATIAEIRAERAKLMTL